MDVDDLGRFANAGGWDGGARGDRIEDALWREQGRYQPGPALEHHLDGLVVEEDAVLDAADAGPHGGLDARRPLRVRHDGDASGRRLLDEDRQLRVPKMAMTRVIAGRQDTARGADLDLIGAADDLAHSTSHLIGAADDARRHGPAER